MIVSISLVDTNVGKYKTNVVFSLNYHDDMDLVLTNSFICFQF